VGRVYVILNINHRHKWVSPFIFSSNNSSQYLPKQLTQLCHQQRYNAKTKVKRIIIKQEGLEKLLSKVNPSNSSGPDNIPNRILKERAVQLAPILQKIFQVSIDLPKDWRDANISDIFKKGDKHLPENYRPVSLTSVPCKLLEHIICRHLMKHLETNRIQIRLLIRRITTTNNNKRLSERTRQ